MLAVVVETPFLWLRIWLLFHLQRFLQLVCLHRCFNDIHTLWCEWVAFMLNNSMKSSQPFEIANNRFFFPSLKFWWKNLKAFLFFLFSVVREKKKYLKKLFLYPNLYACKLISKMFDLLLAALPTKTSRDIHQSSLELFFRMFIFVRLKGKLKKKIIQERFWKIELDYLARVTTLER